MALVTDTARRLAQRATASIILVDSIAKVDLPDRRVLLMDPEAASDVFDGVALP
jgi:hypothetical protein